MDKDHQNESKDQAQSSVLTITFESPNSTLFEIQSTGVTALQLLMLSQYLDMVGRNALAQEAAMQMQMRMQQADRSKIITPQDVRKIERL